MSDVVYLTIEEVIIIHERIIERFGGSFGIRDRNRLESALFLPRQTFDQIELYPTLIEKAAILCFAIVSNHPFVDGNKRTGHHVMELFLRLNGYTLPYEVDDEENAILNVAAGRWNKDDLLGWLNQKVRQI